MADVKMPLVGDFMRGIGVLKAVEIIPVEPLKDYIFEDTEARCELRFGDEIIKRLETFSDWYGIGTGEETAIKEMKIYSKERGITRDSELEVVVIRVTTQFRARPTGRIDEYDNKGFMVFESINFGSRRGVPNEKEEIIWSSKND
jgi:hypothetical protein